jgi:hypothetical protein
MISRMARWTTAVLIVSVAALIVAGCAPSGVSQADIDAAKQQLQAQQQKNTELQKQLSDSQAQAAAKDKTVADAQATAAAAVKAAGSAPTAAPAGSSGGAQILMGVFKPTPAPPPPPAPTAVPGITPTPRPGPPASIYENAGPFFAYVEVLATTSVSKFGWASTVSCTSSGVFKRGQKMVFRFEVLDTTAGKRLTDKDLNYVLTVKFPNGDEPAARFSQRGGGSVPGAPWMWSAAWDIPTDYPLGGVDYTINIKAPDGKLTVWKAPAVIDPKEDSRPKIVE